MSHATQSIFSLPKGLLYPEIHPTLSILPVGHVPLPPSSPPCLCLPFLCSALSFQPARNRHGTNVPEACRLCQSEEESFLHFITTCSSLSQDRLRIFQRSFLTPCTWDVDEVLEFSRLPAISGFMDRHGFYSVDTDTAQDN